MYVKQQSEGGKIIYYIKIHSILETVTKLSIRIKISGNSCANKNS